MDSTSKDKYIHCGQALMYDPLSQRDDGISWCFRKQFACQIESRKNKNERNKWRENENWWWKVKPIQRKLKGEKYAKDFEF